MLNDIELWGGIECTVNRVGDSVFDQLIMSGHQDRIAACSRLISKSGGRDAVAFDNRGAEYGDKGDYDRAIVDYTASIRLDPKYAPAYNSRGNSWYNKGDHDRAIADYDAAIRIDPAYAAAFKNRGDAQSNKGDLDRASFLVEVRGGKQEVKEVLPALGAK